jgi:hypothetical protein
MGKKPNKLRPDAAETAYRVMLEATGQVEKTPPPEGRTEKNPEAVARGSKGGKKGGKARAAKLAGTQRAEVAKSAASARWKPSATIPTGGE